MTTHRDTGFHKSVQAVFPNRAPSQPLHSEKVVVILRENGDTLRFTVAWSDREWFELAKEVFPSVDKEVHIPEAFVTITHSEPVFSACVYQGTTDYLQARWGRKLDDSDRKWLAAHPYATDHGVPREYMATCIQQMVEPYGMGVVKIALRRGVLHVPPELKQWMEALGCNPFALVDHSTTNAEAAERIGIDVDAANKMWRVEFADRPLACSITGEQGGDTSRVNTGQRAGHTRYLPPRGGFHDWFVSCQLDALERIEYAAATPNPEYVPRLGAPSLYYSNVTRPDGQPVAVRHPNYTYGWVSPEKAEELKAAKAKTVVVPSPSPAATSKTGGNNSACGTNADVEPLKLPRIYNPNYDSMIRCPNKECKEQHKFPTGTTMMFLSAHADLGLHRWKCRKCNMHFTITMGKTKKEFNKFLRNRPKPQRTAQHNTTPGWCKTCARVMDPDKVGEDGVCDECWFKDEEGKWAGEGGADTVQPHGPERFACVSCGTEYTDPREEFDGTGTCVDCVNIAFNGIACPHDGCKVDLQDELLPHFLGMSEDQKSYEWTCVKCQNTIAFDVQDQDPDFMGAMAFSKVLSLPDSMEATAAGVILQEWIHVREFLEEMERTYDESTPADATPDAPFDVEAYMPGRCPTCKAALNAENCQLIGVDLEAREVLYQCDSPTGRKDHCGTGMLVRLERDPAPTQCMACRKTPAIPPEFKGISNCGMLQGVHHLFLPLYSCSECFSTFLDYRKQQQEATV